MTEITLDLRKTLEQNAAACFEHAKKARRKIQKIDEIVAKTQAQLVEAERKAADTTAAEAAPKKAKRKPQWYEKYRWFFSSEGFLVIGGRDAVTGFHIELPCVKTYPVEVRGEDVLVDL